MTVFGKKVSMGELPEVYDAFIRLERHRLNGTVVNLKNNNNPQCLLHM